MRHRTAWAALAAAALLSGCAGSPSQQAGTLGARPVAERPGVVPCSTTSVVIATVSRCGAAGLKMGVAAD